MKTNLVLFLSCLICVSCSNYRIDNNENKYLLNDQSNSKYYLIDIIRKAQNDNKLGKDPMIIINGDPVYYHYKKNIEPIKIEKSQIKKIELLKNTDCLQTFGSACKYGLIRITTY